MTLFFDTVSAADSNFNFWAHKDEILKCGHSNVSYLEKPFCNDVSLFRNLFNSPMHSYLLILGVKAEAVFQFHMVRAVMEWLNFTHSAVLFRSLLQNTGPYKAKWQTKEEKKHWRIQAQK